MIKKESKERRTTNASGLPYLKRKAVLFILLVIVTTSLIASCEIDAEPAPVALRHPFDMEITSEDGSHVTWHGYTDGYIPGETETAQLSVNNGTDRPWFGRICLSLLEPHPSDVVLFLQKREFTLAPGDGFQDIVSFQFPADLP